MASTFLSRNFTGSSPTNANKATMSVWIKLSKILSSTDDIGIMGTNDASSYSAAGATQIGFFDGGFYVWLKNSSGTYYKEKSTRVFRDPNAWYHIVVRLDSTQASGDNRIKAWVNNEEITAWNNINDLPQNTPVNINANEIRIGRYTFTGGSHNYFDGSMSHFHLCDGQTYSPSDFGSTDSVTGEWKINTSPSVTYGTNGFFILKDGNSITDSSSNSNDFSLGAGTLSKTEDNPSNNFATFNPLSINSANGNFSYGNTRFATGASSWRTAFTTIGDSVGKYYCEMKYTSGDNQMFGIFSLYKRNEVNDVGYVGDSNLSTRAVGIAKPGNIYINGSNANYTGGSNTSWTTGDIIQIAMDRTNKKVYFGKNGTWMGSGDPTSGATGTGAVSFTSDDNEAWGFATSCYASTSDTNFGNGYFGTTAVSSAGTNASGNGIFEYDVPAGYTALCTKGLNI